MWNLQNRFTGWSDIDLTPHGIEESKRAGEELRQKGYTFDICFTSRLKRAVKTFNALADEMDCHWIPVHKEWRLNERCYGQLEGYDKQQIADRYGKELTY